MRIQPIPALAVLVALLAGCTSDNELQRRELNRVAVTAGDFDDVTEPLNRMVVEYERYDGIISVATWDEDYDPSANVLTVEGLLGSLDEMLSYDAVFVASGTRGLGDRVYNGLDDDDQLVTDADVVANVQEYPLRIRSLVATDWAYDLVEVAWPDAIEFVHDDLSLDAAQCGQIAEVSARVTDDRLAQDLGMDTVAVSFNYSNWAVMESVSEDVTVWLRGDVSYRISETEGYGTLTDVPLLVSFEPGGSPDGRVVFSSFHIDTQTDAVIDQVLATVVGDFEAAPPESVAIEE